MKTTIHIKTLLVGALFVGFTACAEEEIPQAATELAGQLHIGSVKIGDAQKASRAIAEGATGASESFPYNQVITGFSNGDKLNLTYSFKQGEEGTSVEATYNGSAWSLDENTAIKPTDDGDKWENLSVTASFLPTAVTVGYRSVPDEVTGFTQDQVQVDTRVYYDKLEASTTITEGSAGHISAVTDLKSNDLGKLTVNFRHAHALLRLLKTEDKIKINSIHEGTLISGIGNLATLWAELAPTTATQEGESQPSTSIFVPLTSVTIENNEYLQAIVPVDYQLNGFKAVLNKGEGHITIEIPLATPKELSANNQYNLSLDITNGAKVEFEKSDKPGWGNDVTLQQSHEKNLQYVEVEEDRKKKFVVNNAQGLQELNKWMNETGGDNVKYIEGYENVDQTASRLSHDIHIAGDIDLSEGSNIIYDLDDDGSNESNWIPLGTSETPYTGTITAADDAEITGLEIHVNTNNGGFVGYLGEEGKIEGLKLQGNFSATNASNFGAVAGYNNGGTISGCVVGTSSGNQTTITGTINVSSSKSYIGGVVGWNNTGLIENCINYATVSAPDYQMVGGVLGENHRLDNCVIKDCKNYGTVTGLQHVGGVVGINHRVVNNCHNEGTVKGKTHVGGVVGMSNDYSPVPDGNGKPGWPIYVINATNKGAVKGEQCVGGVVGSNGSRSTSGGYIVASWNQGDISYALLTGISMLAEGTPAETFYAFGGVVGVNYHHAYTDEESWTDETKARVGNRTSHVIACYNSGSITTDAATNPNVGGVVGRNEEGSNVWASYYSNPTQANEGCGEELNPGDTAGKVYSYVTDWTDAITAMNSAILNYIGDKDKKSDWTYGIVEGPSNSEFTGITTTVKRYVAGTGTGAPQLSETVTGN